MAVGLSISKSEIDSRSGDTARTFQKLFGDVATLQSYLLQTTDPDLVALGYTEAEVTVLKSAFADLSQLAGIWSGNDSLPTPKDFRAFVRQLWGIGSF